MLVNVSLAWVAGRGVGASRPVRRALDLIVPSAACLMCGWLLVHTGWPSLAAASALAIVGLAVGRVRPDRGAAASPPAPRPEEGRAP
jgi:hypothetical protein